MSDRLAAGWSALITGGPYCFLVIIFGESMKVLVGVKRVVDAYVRVRVKSDGTGVDLANTKMAINPFVICASESARNCTLLPSWPGCSHTCDWHPWMR